MVLLQLLQKVALKALHPAPGPRRPAGVRGFRPVVAGWARGVLAGLLAAVIAACAGLSEEEGGEAVLIEGFAGLVAADEPRAAVLGRDVLGNGGNAADAAVAMYFAMSVTLPSRASLGSGGACVLYDSSENKAEALMFLPRAQGGGGVVPQGPRAMAALHARHGLLRWAQLLIPAEQLARFGHSVSRAFANDIKAAESRIRANPGISQALRNNAGELPDEGDRLVQFELAGVMSGLRAQGASYLYSGIFTRRFAEAATAAGHSVTVEQLRESVPQFVEPVAVPFGAHTLYFTVPPAADGLVAAQLYAMLAEELGLSAPGTADRAHEFLEASARAFADRAGWMAPDGEAKRPPAELMTEDHLERLLEGFDPDRHTPSDRLSPPPVALAENPHGASFVAADQWNNLVACSFTMNGLFGAFQMAPDTGILLAAPPRAHNNGLLSPSAAVMANDRVGEAYLAFAASGGSAAPTVLASVLLATLQDETPLKEAVAAPRFHTTGAPDVAFYEEGASDQVLEGLRARGHALREAPALGRINAVYCPNSVKRRRDKCAFATDPRGSGLGFLVQ